MIYFIVRCVLVCGGWIKVHVSAATTAPEEVTGETSPVDSDSSTLRKFLRRRHLSKAATCDCNIYF